MLPGSTEDCLHDTEEVLNLKEIYMSQQQKPSPNLDLFYGFPVSNYFSSYFPKGNCSYFCYESRYINFNMLLA